MNHKIFIIILIITACIVSCNNSGKDKGLTEQQKLAKEIAKTEEDLFDDVQPNRDKAIAMIDIYLDYVAKYPKDTICPEYLFKASEIAMNFDQPHNSIRYLTQIETGYPDYSKYATSIFMKAYVYDYFIGDTEKAREYYTRYIEHYPDHTFVKDAEGALMFLGMNDDQLIELFQDINKYN